MRRKPEYPIVIERESGVSLLWFLAGGVLGAGLALLFAPHSGDKTRRLVARRLGKLRDAAEDAFEDFRDTLSSGEPAEPEHHSEPEPEDEPLTEGEEPGRPDSDGARPAPRRRRGSVTQAAREELEQRLAEARARRHRALVDEDEEPVA